MLSLNIQYWPFFLFMCSESIKWHKYYHCLTSNWFDMNLFGWSGLGRSAIREKKCFIHAARFILLLSGAAFLLLFFLGYIFSIHPFVIVLLLLLLSKCGKSKIDSFCDRWFVVHYITRPIPDLLSHFYIKALRHIGNNIFR